MSNVQGQIDRINGEVSAQKALLSQIATALEGKAAGGAELKSATGTATGGGDTTFTVTGLTFTPSILIVTAPVEDSYGGVESAIGTTDFVYAVGYYTQTVNTKLAWGSAGTLSPANGGCALSLTSVTHSNLNFKTAVTYTWYAYGL